ncbi:MAG: MBL fold metallo-hydrolase [Prolixibacteraceae bacterium]|nr:MBL fold metallo-hydrolase [Prolixibacteraceae bacterium]
MVEVCALASGSNGNCYYVGNEEQAILFDAGINCKQMLLRMEEKGLDPEKVKAVFISHEHIDHVRGARVFCNKFNIPAFFTPGTYYHVSSGNRPRLYRFIRLNSSLKLGPFAIFSFAKNHDANEPCSFRVVIAGHHIGVMTDIGSPTELLIQHMQLCNILFLESNYDEKMLWEGPYPWPLKKRIASGMGHLSNIQALELVTNFANGNLHTLFLSHLSGENNTPDIAYKAFETLHKQYKIIKTSRFAAGDVYRF